MKIDKKIEVQKVENGQVSGIISIRSTEDTVIEKLSITVVIETTGQMDAETCVINSQVIDHNVYLEMHNTLEMPFCIEFDDTKLTYHGKNATIQYGCQLGILFDNKSFKKLEHTIGNKSARIIGLANKEITETDYFEITDSTTDEYYVDEQVIELTLFDNGRENALIKKLSSIIWILATTTVVFVFDWSLIETFVFIIFSIPFWWVYQLLVAAIFLMLEPYLEQSVIAPEIIIKPEQGGFKFEFINDEFDSYEDLKICYFIEEQVVDDRGSGSYRHNKDRYKSKNINITDCYQEPFFAYPQTANLKTFNFSESVSVKWFVEISLNYQSYKYRFKGEFVVRMCYQNLLKHSMI